MPNKDKCHWAPVRIYSWLGFLYDLIQGIIYAEKTKIDKLLVLINTTRPKRSVHVKTMAKITGTLSSLHLAYGDVVYLKSKFMQVSNSRSPDWSHYVRIDKEMKGELLFWSNYLTRGNGKQICNPVGSGSVTYSDASGVACAAIVTLCPGRQSITGRLPSQKWRIAVLTENCWQYSWACTRPSIYYGIRPYGGSLIPNVSYQWSERVP